MVDQCPWEVWQQKCTSGAGFVCWWHTGWIDLEEQVCQGNEKALQPSCQALQDKNPHCHLENSSCHAKSTWCNWWRARSAETQIWQEMSQLSSKSWIKPINISCTWAEKLQNKKHLDQLEIICTGLYREGELQNSQSQSICDVLRNRQVHKLG